jgi:rhodanese-related sulfurtransferase
MFLEQQGFTAVINLEGGVAGWADQVDADFPRY